MNISQSLQRTKQNLQAYTQFMEAIALFTLARRLTLPRYASGVPMASKDFAAAKLAGLVTGELDVDGNGIATLTAEGAAQAALVKRDTKTGQVIDSRSGVPVVISPRHEERVNKETGETIRKRLDTKGESV